MIQKQRHWHRLGTMIKMGQKARKDNVHKKKSKTSAPPGKDSRKQARLQNDRHMQQPSFDFEYCFLQISFEKLDPTPLKLFEWAS
eukprot:g15235.t1